MSDQNTPTPAADAAAPAPAIDPVAEARKIMAGQASGADELAGLKKQVKALWAVVIVTLVLVIAVAAFSLVPRLFGVGRGNLPNGFQPGMQRNPGSGTGQGGAPGNGAIPGQ